MPLPPRRQPTARLLVSALETRVTPATFIVNTTSDAVDPLDGVLSLREAILEANASPDAVNAIEFNIPGSGPLVIQPLAPLPPLLKPGLVVDGYSQPGAIANSKATGPINAEPRIVINGAFAPAGTDGLTLEGEGVAVRGLVINQFAFDPISSLGGNAIKVATTANKAVIAGNYLGVDAAGAIAVPNGKRGVFITDVNQVVVGGTNPADRNIISGNSGIGISIVGKSSDVRVSGNLIGTDKSGSLKIGNGEGVFHSAGGTGNLIGGKTEAERNVISGNSGNAISVSGGTTTNGLTIQGNWIGLDALGLGTLHKGGTNVFLQQTSQGTRILDNAFAQVTTANIFMDFSSGNIVRGNTFGLNGAGNVFIGGAGFTHVLINNGSDDNWVGGPDAADRNVFANDIGSGFNYSVTVRSSTTDPSKLSENNTIQGNWVGFDKSGTVAYRNSGHALEVSDKAENTKILGNVVAGAANAFISVNNSAKNTVIQGNQIGMLVDGKTKSDATGFATGINITGGSVGVLVGGPNAADRNIIAGVASTAITVTGNSGGVEIVNNWIGLSKDGTLKVGVTGQGINLTGNTSGTVVRGNHISGATEGINVNNSGQNVIVGNTIGVNLAGDSSVGFNNTSHAVQIQGNSPNNRIGGPDPADRNFLTGSTSGFRHGLNIFGTGVTNTLVQNNYIGVTKDGTASTGNSSRGIQVSSFAGDTKILNNLISGTANDGINLENAPNTQIRGNIIGLNAAGNAAVKNSSFGISIVGASNNVIIGGSTAADRNIIAGNGGQGIGVNTYEVKNLVIEGNWIGIGADGQTKFGNSVGINMTIVEGAKILNNVISGNNGAGISLNGTHGVIVQGNLIGGTADGKGVVPNGTQGIAVGTGTVGTIIGGTESGQGNRIVGNTSHGIQITNESNLAFTEFISNAQDGVTDRYYYISPLGYWKALEAAANTAGGHLVAINNIEEQNFLETVVMPTFANTSYAIGITDDPFYGTALKTYIWTDPLTPVGYTNWSAGEPNNGAGGIENYGEIIGNNVANFGKWNDYNAGGLRRGILEFATQPTAAQIAAMRPALQNRNNVVIGNVLGLLADGTAAGNLGAGVRIDNAINNQIGGVGAGEGNVIRNSKFDGVQIVGNFAFGNSVRGNSIDLSGNLGIDLADNGVTPNDPLDADTGPNGLQNFPVLASADAGTNTQVSGSIASRPETEFLLDFYASPAKNGTGHGEGNRYLGSASVKTGTDGTAMFSTASLGKSKSGEFISATATDPDGNTSEFALGVEAVGAAAAAKVSSLVINGGAVQRSMVTSLTVTFDQVVTLPTNPAEAFTLTGSKGAVGLSAAVSGTTETVVTLTFSGADIVAGSLYDGKFTLTILAAQVNGGNFDGNGDGTPGDDYASPAYGSPGPNAGTIFRLFGDVNGAGSVDFNDFLALRTAFGLKTGDAGFNPAFDADANGSVDFTDFLAFRTRFGTSTP